MATGPGGGGGFSFANMFSSGGAPNNAAVMNDANKQQNANPNAASGAGVDPATGKPRVVPNSGGMPVDMNNPGADPANVTGPNSLGPEGKGAGTGSPLDPFSDIFKIDTTVQAPVDPLSQKLLELDPKKFAETVSKMDFTRTLNPELVTKALQGDTQAFNQVLNTAFQGAFAASTQMVVGIMEQAFNKNNGRFSSVLEGRFKDFQINSSSSTNKVLNHPAAKPVLQALRTQIANSSVGRNLSATEINTKAEEYFLAMGDALGSLKTEGLKNKNADGSDVSEEIDWGNFLADESGGRANQKQ